MPHVAFNLLFRVAISWRIDFSSVDRRFLCCLNFRNWVSDRFVYRGSFIFSCRSKFSPGIEIATSFPFVASWTLVLSSWISFTCPIFVSSLFMNRSPFFSLPPSIRTPNTAGFEFRNTKSRIVIFEIVGSSSSFFLSICFCFSILNSSRSSISL